MREDFVERTQRPYLQLILGGSGALVLIVLLLWGGVRFYRHWQEGHLIRRGNAYMSGGDLKTAALSARRVLQSNPENPDALRLMAEIAEKTSDRSLLDLRRKVLELKPDSIDDGIAFVRAALRVNDLSAAERALQQLAPRAADKPEFHAASGRLAEMKRDNAAAEKHWARALELAPNDPAYRFQLALSRLSLREPGKRQDGLAQLNQLRSDPKQRSAATRTLLIDGIAQRANPQQSRALASELQSFPEAAFTDRLMYLEILRQLHDPEYDAYVARLKAESSARPADLAALLAWMLRNRGPAEAIQFAESLTSDAITKWPVPFVLAEARAQLRDWTALEQLTRNNTWGDHDFLRRAYLSRALRAQDRQLASEQELAAAQKLAGARAEMVTVLMQTVAEWGWQEEAIDLLWVLTRNPETRFSALRTLYSHYSKAGDTAGLYRTLTKLVELRPNDLALQNNLAQVALLLGADVEYAKKIAAEVAAKEPGNAGYVSTYAYALLATGDIAGARNAMERLTPEQLQDSSVATYYGVILAAAGEKEKAREFLRRASEAPLLPEEKALIAKVESSL